MAGMPFKLAGQLPGQPGRGRQQVGAATRPGVQRHARQHHQAARSQQQPSDDRGELHRLTGSLVMGDGRPGVAGPQLDHLDRYCDEPCSGNDAKNDITREHRCCYAEGYADTGQDGNQQSVARHVCFSHR